MKKTAKKIVIAVLVLFVFLGTAASYNNGVFTGTARGFMGDVVVKVTVERNKIKSVEVTSHSETQGIGTRAVDALPAAIVQKQSPDVDAVSGATMTSNAIKAAVRQALGL